MPLFTGLSIGGGIPWGNFSDAATGTYTDANGAWKYIRFTGAGTLNVSVAGYFDVFLIGGGGGVSTGTWRGMGGNAIFGLHFLSAGAQAVSIGGGGSASGPTAGGQTAIGSLRTGNAGQFPTDFTGPIGPGSETNGGRTSSITGTSVLYGQGNQGPSTANSGNGGGTSTAGASGVAIVRVPL